MHGYELITALEELSGGRWKPSPGSIYPALDRLEHRGYIAAMDEGDDGKQRFELTEAGRQRLEEHRRSGDEQPWDTPGLDRHGDLRRAVSELTGPARQIGRFGTPDQVAAAVVAVKAATAQLYRILADGADTTPDTTPGTAPDGSPDATPSTD